MPAFRVHFTDGDATTVNAVSVDDARKIALSRRVGFIAKVKLIRSAEKEGVA